MTNPAGAPSPPLTRAPGCSSTAAWSEKLAAPGPWRLAARIAGALTIAVVAIALLVALTSPGAARGWLGFRFRGIPATLGVAAAIFVHNLRALAAVGGLLLIAQSPHWAGHERGHIQRAVQRAGELLLAAGIATNVIVIGTAFGAYRVKMLRAALPQGPFELAAYATALALYVGGRDKRLSARDVICTGVLAVSALAVAAALETFVSL
jgi:hypothetical protein